MNPVVTLFVKKYAAGVITRGLQLFGAYLITKHNFAPADVNALQQAIDPGQVVAWCLTVGPELYHAWSNKGHAQLQVGVQETKPTPPKGAMGLMVLALLGTCLCASAQTNAPLSTNLNVLQLPGVTIGGALPTNAVKVANDLITLASPIAPYLTNIDGLALDVDGLYADGHVGGVGMLSFNIPNFMTNVESVGIYGEYNPDENWYMGIAPVSLGMKLWTIPYLNVPITATAIPASACVRFRDSAWGSMSATGGCIVLPFGKSKFYLVLDGGKQWFTQSNAKNPYYGGARLGYALQ